MSKRSVDALHDAAAEPADVVGRTRKPSYEDGCVSVRRVCGRNRRGQPALTQEKGANHCRVRSAAANGSTSVYSGSPPDAVEAHQGELQ